MRTWTQQEIWQRLNPYQRAAAMAIMEADGRDPVAARNALGAIINRSEKTRDPLGDHVSKPIYQPTIEQSQLARLPSILQSQQFQEMTTLAEQRATGKVGDWVGGATHFLAPEKVMLALEAREPQKYRSWRSWTGFDPAKGEYSGVLMRDASHAFLAPEGRHTGPAGAPTPDFAKATGAVAVAGMGDDPSAFAKPQAPALGTAMAGASPTGDAALTFADAFFKQQQQDQEKAEAESKAHAAKANAAIPSLPGDSPMIQGPRLPRIDLAKLMSALKARGVDTVGVPDLGTNQPFTLGSRRA